MSISRFSRHTLVTAALAMSASLAHAGDVNIGVTISGEITPGVYGRVDLTNRPAPPPVVYAQPVIIERTPVAERAAPIYLHVPPGHAKNWRKYCHQYHACNQRVYFVKSPEYEPGYRPDHDHGHPDHYDHDHDHDRGHDHHDH
jgi:hypothetical protein